MISDGGSHGSLQRRRWYAFVHTHRWSLAKRFFTAMASAVFVVLFLLSIVMTFPGLGGKSPEFDVKPPSPEDLRLTAAEQSLGSDLHVTVQLPLSRLVEPRLPSRSWFPDPACGRFRTHFARPGALPDARLASFYRSGNTWTRYLLEAAAGLFTCGPTWEGELADELPTGPLPSVADLQSRLNTSHGTSDELRQAGFVAEDMPSAARVCLLTKTHAFAPHWRRLSSSNASSGGGDDGSTDAAQHPHDPGYALPAILLVRDPFRALISLRHYHVNSSAALAQSRAAEAAFSGAEWRQFVERYSRHWLELADDWAASPQDTLLVAYERLVAGPGVELQRMLEFLGVAPSSDRMDCVMQHLEGGFRNSGHPVLPQDGVFDKEMQKVVWARILQLNRLLVDRGYRRLPVERYSFFWEV